jgi:hypothetical protein
MKKMFKLILTTTLLFVVSEGYSQVAGNNDDTTKTVAPLNIGAIFRPSGYMGCDKGIDMTRGFTDKTRPDETCYRIVYERNCPLGYAGVYWLNRDENWGQYAGMDLSKNGFSKVTFWVRGETGDEVIEFGSGMKNNSTPSNKDSYKEDLGFVKLSKEWKQYTINLEGADLSSVIGAFYWSASWDDNSTGLIFYLDDILFE